MKKSSSVWKGDVVSDQENNQSESTDDRLQVARNLVSALESGDESEVATLLDTLGAQHERSLFNELGRLTRQLHEALNSFRMDSRLSEITETDIPDAKERLSYVVTMTEQAANRTLNAIEDSMPRLSRISDRSGELAQSWERFRSRELDVQEFRELSRELSEFLGCAKEESVAVSAQLSEVMMAQDFQDLTGQVIRRVIDLVQEVEEGLVGLVRVAGERMARTTEEIPTAAENKNDSHGYGPAVPGVDKADVVHGQDEVDDLLSSLGF